MAPTGGSFQSSFQTLHFKWACSLRAAFILKATITEGVISIAAVANTAVIKNETPHCLFSQRDYALLVENGVSRDEAIGNGTRNWPEAVLVDRE